MGNIEYKCPNCGGSLVFDATSQKVTCEYCGAEFEVSDVKEYNDAVATTREEDYSWDDSTEEFSSSELKNLNVYMCDCCGGQIVADDNTTATSCPYCGSPIILKGRLEGSLKPDYVIPFKNTSNDLVPMLDKFLKKKLFLPNSFKKFNEVEQVKGLYVPFWVHDADANGYVRFKGEIERKWTSGDYRYKEIKYYSIIRDGSLGFNKIPVDGSKSMPDDLMESIEPFDFNGAVKFDPVYLSGHLSEKYDVDKNEVLPRVNERIKNATVAQFRTTVKGYDEVKLDSASISLYNTRVSYCLYPVWTMATRYKNKSYLFAMNGQTNKMVGNLPCAGWKVLVSFLSWFLGLGGLIGLALCGMMTKWDAAAFIIGGVIGLIVAIIFCVTNKKKLKCVQKQKTALQYYRDGSMRISNSRDIYLYKKVTKTKISS